MAYPDQTTSFGLSQGEHSSLPAADLIAFQWSVETDYSTLWVYVFCSVLGKGDGGSGVETA